MQADLQKLTTEYRILLHHAFSSFLTEPKFNEKPYRILTKSVQPVDMPRTEAMEDLYSKIDERIAYWTKRFNKERLIDRQRALLPAKAVRSMYFLRNPFFDAILPIAL